MTPEPPEPKHDPLPEGSEQPQPFVPPETPDSVPAPHEHPAKPEAMDKDFTPPDAPPPEDDASSRSAR
jgi:hypothetical protein